MDKHTHRNSLKPGHRVGPYEIMSILGQGGFGITCLAKDINLDRKVAIKEYLPVELAVRDSDTSMYPVSGKHGEQFNRGLERFISEAQTLARFKHPNIVRVLTILRENNTAYIIMGYNRGAHCMT